MPRVSVVVSGDFCRFKLALLSLLSMSKDEEKRPLISDHIKDLLLQRLDHP